MIEIERDTMNFISLLNTIATLFVLIVVGFISGKLGIIDEISSKKLSKLIINIGQPFLLISSLTENGEQIEGHILNI